MALITPILDNRTYEQIRDELVRRIPDTTKIEFLRLLGVQPRTAMTAKALLAISTDLSTGVQVQRGIEAKAGAVSFETQDEVYAWPLDAVAVGKMRAPQATTKAEK